MMIPVQVLATNIISPLGFSASENHFRMCEGKSSVMSNNSFQSDDGPLWLSAFSEEQEDRLRELTHTAEKSCTKFERMMIASAAGAIKESDVDPSSDKTVFICSTTKGNILELELHEHQEPDIAGLELYRSAVKVSTHFKNPNDPVLVSNACISGVAALIVARRYLQEGLYDHAIVAGADTLSNFVISGFRSFQALSPERCKPFSAQRDGINLGEAAACMVLGRNPSSVQTGIEVTGGSMSNDANHISGPSRTGMELAIAIRKALAGNGIEASQLDFISAHGTATPYNDEMEAKALHLCSLDATPVNSMKAYVGHTLGAAGLLESAICIESMRNGLFPSSAGYTEQILEPKVNVVKENIKSNFQHCLKTASGFGGCNAAIVFSKN